MKGGQEDGWAAAIDPVQTPLTGDRRACTSSQKLYGCNGHALARRGRRSPAFRFHWHSAPGTRSADRQCRWEATSHLLRRPEGRSRPGHAAQGRPAARGMTSWGPGGLRRAGWGRGGRRSRLPAHWGLGGRKPGVDAEEFETTALVLKRQQGPLPPAPGGSRSLRAGGRGLPLCLPGPLWAEPGDPLPSAAPHSTHHPHPGTRGLAEAWRADPPAGGQKPRSPGPPRKSSACRVYKARPSRPGPGSGTSSRRAPSQANQYHFPVLELGNYEGERLPDLSPALHYFADIKINCLILGKHMLRFRLSALVCSGIICIDLPASSQFCLLTSWIIREGALGERGVGAREEYEEE